MNASSLRILVVAPNWIGDMLMAQPLLARLKVKRPEAAIDVLAPPWVAPVVAQMAEVDTVIETPFRHGALQLRERWNLGRSLRAQGYGQAIVLPNTWKSALVPFFADIPVRSGYIGESRYGLLNLKYRRPRSAQPMREHYAALAEAPGATLEGEVAEPRLHIEPQRVQVTAAAFGFAPQRNAVLCPGAEFGPAKRWPAERFGALAAALAGEGWTVWLLGAAGDAALCQEVVNASGGCATSLAGRTTIDQACALIAAADLVVSNDSGLMHIAAALGRPQIAIFGSSSPLHTPPHSARARVVWLHTDCSPCFARECPLGHFRCMREIEPAHILAEVHALDA